MTRIVAFLKHNAIALAALFVALGGTSYAAVAIPKDSVGARQLRKGAVTAKKIHSGAITPGKLASKAFGGRILAVTEIAQDGSVLASDPHGVKVAKWTLGSGGIIIYPHKIPKGCWPAATPTGSMAGGGPSGPASVAAGSGGLNAVQVAENGVVPFTLMIVCLR